MTKYLVTLTTGAAYSVEMEAESAEEAAEKVELIGAPSLCHQCARIDLGDWFAEDENIEVIE